MTVLEASHLQKYFDLTFQSSEIILKYLFGLFPSLFAMPQIEPSTP